MTRDIRIVTEAELRRTVALDLDLIDAVEGAFSALSGGSVVMPPVMSMHLPDANGEVDVKTAFVPGMDGFALKVSPGFFDNPALGLPSLNGLMILFSARTGLVETVFLDNGYLTDLRTAAAGAVAARHLAPERVRIAGVIGAGVQARLQIEAAHLVRPFERVLVWARDAGRAQACARDISDRLGVAAEARTNPRQVVQAADLVVTTTPAKTPIIEASWLHEGLHVTAMGSDQAGKCELHPDCLRRADLYVCDRESQAREMGELRVALAAGFSGAVVELGDIVTGRAEGRRGPNDVTICDLTGTGAQDTAIASFVAARLGSDTGTVIST